MNKRLLTAGAVLSLAWLLCSLPSGQLRGCGPDTYETQYRFSLFRPDLDGRASLEPFYYASRFLNSDIPDPAGEDYRRNCEEWQRYCGTAVLPRDVYEIQYRCSPDDFRYAAETGDWGGLRDNTFVQWLRRPAHRPVLRYLQLAKTIEFGQLGDKDPWNSDRYRFDPLSPAAPDTLLDQCLRGFDGAPDAFLRQRYAFQALKLFYYQPGRPARDRGRALFEQHLRNSGTMLADWGLVYFAGMLQDSLERNEALLQAFLRSEEKKVFVYQQLREGDLRALIAHSRDSALLAGAHVLLALKTPGPALALLQQVAGYEPANRYLPMLIGREVNKIEEWLWSAPMLGTEPLVKANDYGIRQYRSRPDNYDYDQPDTQYAYYAAVNERKDRAYCREFITFLKITAARQPSLEGHALLAAAHLSNVTHDFGTAAALLDRLPAFSSAAWEEQRLVNALIAQAHLQDVRSASTKAFLLAGIRKLQAGGLPLPGRGAKLKEGWRYDDVPSAHEIQDNLPELLLLLSRRFERAGDRLSAGLLYRKAQLLTSQFDGSPYHGDDWASGTTDSSTGYADFAYFDRCGSVPLMDSLIAFGQTAAPSGFDRFLLEDPVPADFYRDLKGTILFRQGDYRAALGVFEQMPDSFWEKEYAFAAYLPRTDLGTVGGLIPGAGHGTATHPAHSKKLLTANLLRIGDSLALPLPAGERSVLLYRMGNALYNTSYYGRGWMMFSYGKSAAEPSAGSDSWNPSFPALYHLYADRYYRLVPAMRHYREALMLARNSKPELAAQCLLMLALCDRLQQEGDASARPMIRDGIRYARAEWTAPPSAYLHRLRRDYAGTALYEEAAFSCPDVAAYLKRH